MGKGIAGNAIVATIYLLLLGVASWTIHGMLNRGATDLLARVGVTNYYVKGIIVVAIIAVLLIFAGFKSKKVFKKLLD